MRQENRFAGKHPFPSTKQLAHQALVGFGTITHLGFKRDTVIHVVHGPGLGDDCLARVEFDFYDLDVIPDDFIVDFMASHN